MGFWDAVSSVASSVSNAVSDVAGDVEDGVKTVVGAPVHLIQEGCQEAYKGLSCAADEGFQVLKGIGCDMERAIVGGGGMLLHGIEGLPGDAWDAVKESYDAFKDIF
jgi:hypothetical protein